VISTSNAGITQPTYCYSNNCGDHVVENKFSIHDLWPNTKPPPQNCLNQGLKEEMIMDIKIELEEK